MGGAVKALADSTELCSEAGAGLGLAAVATVSMFEGDDDSVGGAVKAALADSTELDSEAGAGLGLAAVATVSMFEGDEDCVGGAVKAAPDPGLGLGVVLRKLL